MRSFVLGESNKVVMSLKPSVERLVKKQLTPDEYFEPNFICYMEKMTIAIPGRSSGP